MDNINANAKKIITPYRNDWGSIRRSTYLDHVPPFADSRGLLAGQKHLV